MRNVLGLTLTSLSVALGAAGCGSSSPSSPDAGPPGPGAAVAIAVQPTAADVLTCNTLQLTAIVTGTSNPAATWTLDGKGLVDGQGLYTAPLQVPSPSLATVTATSVADPTKSAAARLALWTALPQVAAPAGASGDSTLFHHQMAATGKQVYAVLMHIDDTDPDHKKYSLQVAASSDGGKTFGAPVVASDVPNPAVALDGPSLAVDAGDPNTVYVSYLIDAGAVAKTSDATVPESGKTVALAVSTDAGAHWINYVLESHVSGFGEWPDVASPKAGTVVVEATAFRFPTPYMVTYVDETKGAGFGTGTGDEWSWTTAEAFPLSAPYSSLDQDGGSFGDESPRLVADGAGNVCVVYVGGNGEPQRVAVQCSGDAGKSFGAPVEVAVEAEGEDFHHPSGAFSPTGSLAITYWKSSTSPATIHLAVSKDGGKTFAPPTVIPSYQLPASVGIPGWAQYPALTWDGGVLWLAYTVGDGGGPGRLIVDKSCDGGVTWSGSQLLNGPEPTIQDDYGWPGLLVAGGKPRVFSATHVSGVRNDTYRLIPLVP